jgi:GNAT superfamily N-acetyltransferase
VALDLEAAGHPCVGVSRYVRIPEEPEVAEAAVAVVDDYQGRGLGALLLEALGAVALENGITRFRGHALEDNRPIREVMEAMGATTAHDSPGMLRIEVDLPARMEEMRGSPLREILRIVARGDGPVFLRPGRFSTGAPG